MIILIIYYIIIYTHTHTMYVPDSVQPWATKDRSGPHWDTMGHHGAPPICIHYVHPMHTHIIIIIIAYSIIIIISYIIIIIIIIYSIIAYSI